MASLPCQFCGKEAGFFAGRNKMFRCPNCGTVLCDNCVKRRFSFWRSALSVVCILLIPLTTFISLLGVFLFGFHGSPQCLKCSSRVKSIT